MKLVVLLLAGLLAGCTTVAVPVRQKFPDAVPELKQSCEALMTIKGDTVTITDLLKTVVENYTRYHQCAARVEGWQEWYDAQRKIFEGANQ
jgi:inhibitor of KinA sporulation pathway (predicted exonuclease)